ncbi:MAG: ribosomal protein S18-alanine N-acetyltransferase [Deltaproteobacteria bacterium]|nr:ribosomal protein S18-alanine N-acetyltransferase [Deltaproteobacteria bacterium]
MGLSIHIVRAQIEDLPKIDVLEKQSFPDPWSLALFEELLENPSQNLYVARKEKDIVGYVAFWKILDEVHILNLCVAPGQRREGIGSQLLQFCLNQYSTEEVSLFSLEVRQSNRAAQSLYQKFGFEIKTIRKNYYPNHENALIMMRPNSPCMAS